MNVTEYYFDFLRRMGAKSKVEAIIKKGIEEWKGQQAYKKDPVTDYRTGDTSGIIYPINGKTIGDITQTDKEVLKAYTGDSQATYVSRCGIYYICVYDRVREDVLNFLEKLRYDFITENSNTLLDEYEITSAPDWDATYSAINKAMWEIEGPMNEEWLYAEFPNFDIYENDFDIYEDDYEFLNFDDIF